MVINVKNSTITEKINFKILITFILLLLLSSCSPKFQEACTVIINDTKIQFPLSVKNAIEKLDFEYNNDLKAFQSNKVILDKKIVLTTLMVKKSADASPLDNWFKTEEDFYKDNVLWVRGYITEKILKSKDLFISQTNVNFRKIKKGLRNDEEVEYCIGIYNDCLTVILFRPSGSTFNYTDFLIIEGIHQEEEDFFQYLL